MTKTERERELRKTEKMYYFNDFIEDDKEFCYEESYFDAYFIENEVILSDFY